MKAKKLPKAKKQQKKAQAKSKSHSVETCDIEGASEPVSGAFLFGWMQ
jgi:hypothetical protein